MNLIPAVFDPEYRLKIAQAVKHYGVKRTQDMMIKSNLHPSFVKALIKSIMAKEGW